MPKTDFIILMGRRMKMARMSAGLTQAKVADELQVSRETIVSWEGGNKRASYEKLYALAELYQVPMGYFFGEYDTPLDRAKQDWNEDFAVADSRFLAMVC